MGNVREGLATSCAQAPAESNLQAGRTAQSSHIHSCTPLVTVCRYYPCLTQGNNPPCDPKSKEAFSQFCHEECSIIQCSTVVYKTIQYWTVHYSAGQYNTVLYSTVIYSIIQHSTILYSTVLYSVELYCTVLRSKQQYRCVVIATACPP